ncbi:MAG: LysR family transcriptional regulator [Pseudohongiellaceae bacterium]
MKFTLRQLEVFRATARYENISRAALDLAMSQSAASDSLRELEHQFDVQLFDRIGKRLQLNDFGRLLLPRAEELLSRASELEASLSTHEESGTLKIGTTFSIGNALCVPLIDQYRRRYPHSQVSVEMANTGRISSMVAGFELDLGLIEGEINNPALEITPWREDELVIFCSPGHPLAARDNLTRHDLLQARWILRETGSGTRQTFDRVLHDLLPQLRIELELQAAEAILQAVRSGMGLGCLSRLLVHDALERGELVALRARGRDFRRHFYLIIHRQKYRSAAIRHWLQLCAEHDKRN